MGSKCEQMGTVLFWKHCSQKEPSPNGTGEEMKTIYYEDELNDEFSEAIIEPRRIDENYPYEHKNPLWKLSTFLVQNVISLPIKLIYVKLKFRIKYVGREKLKPYKKQGYFVYGNHTQPFADTFIITNTVFPKRNYLIVNPENVSMKGLGNFVQQFGAIPIPNVRSGMKNFLQAIKSKIEKGYSITIFPEAHIWPYYTKIRPFKNVSFRYPIEMKTPTFCVTNTYQKRRNGKVKITTYVDGPFFPDEDLNNIQDKKQSLRDKVYKAMVERSKQNDFEYIKYIKKTSEEVKIKV